MIQISGYGNFGKVNGYLTTGYSEDWKLNNIYDVTGSVRTVTNEIYSNSFVIRGSYFVEGTPNFKNRTTGISGWGYGSRVVLYVK